MLELIARLTICKGHSLCPILQALVSLLLQAYRISGNGYLFSFNTEYMENRELMSGYWL